jgi:Zn-finger domain-containing protein
MFCFYSNSAEEKRKNRNVLTLQKRMELLEDLESGMPKRAVREKYDISSSGYLRILKSKQKIIESHKKLSVLKNHNRKFCLTDKLETALLIR